MSLITPAFLSLAAATLVFFVAGGIVLPIVPQFAERQLGLSPAEMGVAIAAFSVASLVARPIVGWSTDRFGRRPALVSGAALSVVALLLHLAASSIGLLVAARALFGVGEAFFFVASLAAASDLAPPERRGEAFSFFSLSLYLGLPIGPLIGETAFGIGSYAAVWLVAAAIAGCGLVLAWLLPETAPLVRTAERARLFHPAGILPGIVIFLGVFGMAGFLAFVPVYVEDVGVAASLPLGIYAGIVVVLRIVGAQLPDRFGAARLSGSALLATAAGLAIIGSVPTAVGLMLGTATMAVGGRVHVPGAHGPRRCARRAERAGDRRRDGEPLPGPGLRGGTGRPRLDCGRNRLRPDVPRLGRPGDPRLRRPRRWPALDRSCDAAFRRGSLTG